jgi:ribosomal protein L16/L10AE
MPLMLCIETAQHAKQVSSVMLCCDARLKLLLLLLLQVRMGKGKGALDYWAAPIRPGQILFEMDRCSKADVLAALHSIQSKMPIKLGFVEWS